LSAIDITFEEEVLEGIPNTLPPSQPYDDACNHAPKRKIILSSEETKLALKNALRYFDKKTS
jgi:urocanate hydratase